jgi:6-phosphogluconolactonase (cycloisomerase 2 family)
VDPTTGALTELASSPFPTGSYPVAVQATPSGKFVYVTNQYDSTISAYSLDGTNGTLTPIQGSPFATGPYPFGLAISPSGKLLYTANNGPLFGQQGPGNISAFSIDGATGALTPVAGSPFAAGALMNWVAFTPSGKYLYASNSASTENDVYGFVVNSDGSLTGVPGSPYAAGTYPGQLAVSPSGKYLYVPNWDSSDISAYSINSATGALTPISGSPFAVSGVAGGVSVTPSGQFLYSAGSSSNDISAFRIKPTTGALTPISGSPFPAGLDTIFVAISDSGRFAYATDYSTPQISEYSIDLSTGALTPLAKSFSAGHSPIFMAFANPAVKSCGALNVSAEATLAPGAYTRQSKGSDLWNEKLGITNGVTPISGPLSVVLTDLPSSTTTLSGTYPGLTTTYCFSATGNYVVPIDSLLPPGNDDTLLAGEGLSVPFVFAAQGGSSVKPTHYKAKLISGTLDK